MRAVQDALVRVVAESPGVGGWELADRVRTELEVPVGAAVAQIRALERAGTLVATGESGEDGYALTGAEATESATVADLLAEGNPRVLAAYREARTPALYAYCSKIRSLDAVSLTISATFAAVSEAARDRSGIGGGDLDALLLATVRTEAALRTAPHNARTLRGRIRRRLGLSRAEHAFHERSAECPPERVRLAMLEARSKAA